jgi:hypothetical protein
MHLIAALFFRFVPYWVLFIAAAWIAWSGFTFQKQDWTLAAARKELIQQAPPATIPINAFSSDAPSEVPVELSVSAQVALDHNTRLVRKTNSVTTGEDLMYVLVDPTVGADTNMPEPPSSSTPTIWTPSSNGCHKTPPTMAPRVRS